MNDTAMKIDIEDCSNRLLCGLEKVEYLLTLSVKKYKNKPARKQNIPYFIMIYAQT